MDFRFTLELLSIYLSSQLVLLQKVIILFFLYQLEKSVCLTYKKVFFLFFFLFINLAMGTGKAPNPTCDYLEDVMTYLTENVLKITDKK